MKQHNIPAQKNVFHDISNPVIAIMGPTASGKTALACTLYDKNPHCYDIISVDSALVYRDMNIGTAKPTVDELRAYPHALVDIIDPTESYSAADFASDARKLIKQSHDAGKTPILVGGTMLYFKALFGGFDNIPASVPEIRSRLSEEVANYGIASLYARLQEVDTVTANKLNPTDTQRIMRAMEVYDISGKPISYFQTGVQPALPKAWQLYALMPERKWLHERIKMRLDTMWAQGFLTEVQQLVDTYLLTPEHTAMRAVGYRQALEYLINTKQTNDDRQTMEDKALFATRQLAKRQFTWLRKFTTTYTIKTFESHDVALNNLQ